ncbi:MULTISPECIES: radical SAM family heme chaperone HemW [Bacillaceae]|uniref:Heme chaperone HemW n=1 Tax=Gottfriedia luciferensis TaxID=178774 RepID=A0ABX2ZKH8_9BACI|nr:MULTISPECIES: radical SAM family heme chaperone HemW [Bacillaceae]ODG90211.1 coproporphyrinogen III oxidase [Gottfriedia luciferensis]PGZ93653.1 coproporphyrinogen III oxidase [Bacillus sp. AFS029533]SFC98911.1 oxygen-independent coproporphyrinogen-3 oxidase [Bacillus sp. UNCCL81]
MASSVYIHIPFCQQICYYCDFNKFMMDRQPVDQYLEYLEKEIVESLKRNPIIDLKTVFVGGGTPTALTLPQTQTLVDMINKHIIKGNKEIEMTFESNPNEISKEKLQILKDGGVNRISFGAQTFDEGLLKKIGRTHSPNEIEEAIQTAKEVGIDNINLDLMYALPGQTMEQFVDSLDKAMKLPIQHISAYSLIIEPKTVFYIEMNRGKLKPAPEEDEAAMYDFLMNYLEKNGFHQYEISNFEKNGLESKHNLVYWNNEEYFGFGAGAHGYINGIRYSNAGPLKKYFQLIDDTGVPIVHEHTVTKQEKMEEEMFLGLRKMQGVSERKFQEKFGSNFNEVFPNVIEKLMKDGLVEMNGEYLRLSHKGKLLGNEVFQAFLL